MEARLIEVVQDHLRDRVTRGVALRCGVVSRSFVYRIERNLFLNPRVDRYIALCSSIALDVYVFSTRVDAGEAWSEALREAIRIEHGSPSRFAAATGIARTTACAWTRAKHFPRLSVADVLGSRMTVRPRG